MRVSVEARVNTTEDPDKVEAAVRAIFPDAEVQRSPGWIRGETSSLTTLMRKATEERIRDAARGTLWRGRIDDGATRFEISKQAAFAGRLNFNEVRHPLGDVVVTVVTDAGLERLLDELAPPTRAEVLAKEGRSRTASHRAGLHREESELEAIGSDIDTGWDDLDATVKPRDEEE